MAKITDAFPFLLFITLSFIISITYFGHTLSEDGIFVHGDQFFPLNFDNMITRSSYLWDSWADTLSVHYTKFFYFIPFKELELLNISSENMQKIYFFSTIFLASFFTFIGFYLISKKIISDNDNLFSLIGSIIGVSLYIFNPWVIFRIHHHPPFVIGYSLLPILLYIFYDLLDTSVHRKEKNINFLIISMIFAVGSIYPHNILILFIPSLLLFFFIFIIVAMPKIKIVRTILKLVIVTILINAFWIVPYTMILFNEQNISPPYQLEESIDSYNKNSNLINALNYYTILNADLELPYFNSIESKMIGTLIFILVILGITIFKFDIKNERNKTFGAFFLLLILLILPIISIKSLGIFKIYFFDMVKSVPLGWILKETDKLLPLFILPSTYFILILFSKVWNKIKNKIILTVIISILLLLPIFHSLPLFDGEFKNHFYPAKPPKAYYDVTEKYSKDQNLLLFPPRYQPIIFQFDWLPVKTLGPKTFDIYSFSDVFGENPITVPYIRSIFDNMEEDDIEDAKISLKRNNIRYVVIHPDLYHPNLDKSVYKILYNMNKSSLFDLDYDNYPIFVFKSNDVENNKIWTMSNNLILIDGDFRLANALNISNDKPIIFLDKLYKYDQDNIRFLLNNSKIMTLNKGSTYNSLAYIFSNERINIIDRKNVIKNNNWSVGQSKGMNNNDWIFFLKNKKLRNYAGDFNNPIIFSEKSGSDISFSFYVHEDGEYMLMTRYLKSKKGGNIDIIKDTTKININTKIEYEDYFYFSTYNLTLKKGMNYMKVINTGGINALNILSIIPKKEFTDIASNLSSLESKMHIAFVPTLNAYLDNQGDIKNLIIDGNADNIYLEPFTTNKTLIFSESFDNITKFRERTNSFAINIDYEDKVDDKGSLYIKPIESDILVKPNYSFLSSDEDIVVDSNRYYYIEYYIKSFPSTRSHMVIYKYNKNTKQWSTLKGMPSNLPLIVNQWSRYEDVIYIPENISKIKIIPKAEYITNASIWYDSLKIYEIDLSSGHKFYTNHTGKLYMLNISEPYFVMPSLDQNTNNKPINLVEYYERIDPTLYKVKVNSSGQFLLAFSEGYDPFWAANIDKVNGIYGSKNIVPIPIYSVINGFWINESGNLDITIRYKPQNWFENGLLITIITLVSYIGYIFVKRR